MPVSRECCSRQTHRARRWTDWREDSGEDSGAVARTTLKDLLVEMVLSTWFRADALEGDDRVRRIALRDAGARRLLTPEELARKTTALTGFSWGRRISTDCYPLCEPRPTTALTGEYRLLYGGIDSDGITERARDITSVMEGVARTHALEASCPIILRELYLAPEEEQRLFSGVDPFVTPTSEFSTSFELTASSRNRKETLSFGGPLSAGQKTVTLTYLNDYWDPPDNDRNVRPRSAGRARSERPRRRQQ